VNARIRNSYRKDPQKKIDKTRQYHLDNPEWSKQTLAKWYQENYIPVANRQPGQEDKVYKTSISPKEYAAGGSIRKYFLMEDPRFDWADLSIEERRRERFRERGDDPEVRAKRRYWAREDRARRRAAERNATDIITDSQYVELLEEFNFSCWICERNLADLVMEWDHYQPISKGGQHIIANMRPSCMTCNRKKNNIWPVTVHLIDKIRSDVLGGR
jgi:5-methylcytosine-specific restriction endonuclease McrA